MLRGALTENRNASTEKHLIDRLAWIEDRIREIDARFLRDFPDYAALATPKSMEVTDVQASLLSNEALVLLINTPEWYPTPGESFTWVITKTDTRWVRSELATGAVTEKVKALRCGLDPASWEGKGRQACLKLTGRPAGTKLLPFRTDIAYELYTGLFGEIEDMIAGKDLIVVPNGPLTTLPFQVLVTEKPTPGTGYREARWLIADHALTVLPSVSSLAALRRGSKSLAGKKPYLGIGNPLLTGLTGENLSAFKHQHCPAETTQVAMVESKGIGVPKELTSYFRGEVADVTAVRSLDPLPDSAKELCAIARSLGVPESEVLLGERATETVLKKINASGTLEDYRVLHLSTHGLLSGQSEKLAGLAEPAIVLTPPADDTPAEQLTQDDGLLTASEVTELKLGAEWVILSACNTASGDGGNAEALSGLARAFFYAGAKTLIVAHWPVFSKAAVELTTGTFKAMNDAEAMGKSIGRAEALRRSMLALIHKGGVFAHPQVWAPFVLVGEGAVGR